MSVNSDQAVCEYNHVDEKPHHREENDHRPVHDADPAELNFDEGYSLFYQFHMYFRHIVITGKLNYKSSKVATLTI